MNAYETRITAAITNRELGKVPVSIATSRALEGAYGILEEAPNHNPIIHKVDAIYVNLRTLLRNIVGAVDKDIANDLLAEDLSKAMANELQIIDASVQQFTQGKVEVVPYVCEYSALKRRFPHAVMKETKTPKQTFQFIRETNALNDFELNMGWIYTKKFDVDFDKDDRNVLIMTHYALDLLQRYKFTTLNLVESHTGAVKPPAQWYTKLNNGKHLTNIPFDRFTIQMFGDNSNLFSPMGIVLRRAVLKIAEQNKWTPMTTKAYILDSIKKAYEPALEALAMNLYGGNR